MRSTYLCPLLSDWITDVFFILDVWTQVLVLVRQAPHWLSLFCRPHIKIILMEQISLCCLKSHHFYPQLIRTSSYIISPEVCLLNRLSSVLEFLAICLKSDKGIFFCIESKRVSSMYWIIWVFSRNQTCRFCQIPICGWSVSGIFILFHEDT